MPPFNVVLFHPHYLVLHQAVIEMLWVKIYLVYIYINIFSVDRQWSISMNHYHRSWITNVSILKRWFTILRYVRSHIWNEKIWNIFSPKLIHWILGPISRKQQNSKIFNSLPYQFPSFFFFYESRMLVLNAVLNRTLESHLEVNIYCTVWHTNNGSLIFIDWLFNMWYLP